jgi:Na+/proline symporter
LDIYATTIAVSIAIFVFIGGYSGRKVKQLDDYFVAGRRAPTLLIVGTLVVTQGAAILLSGLTGLNYFEAILVSWLSYTLFTMYSGSRGVIITDTLMFLLFSFATVFFVFYIVSDLGGVAEAIEKLATIEAKPDIASWHGTVGPGTEWPTAMDYLIWTLIIDMSWGIVYAVGPWQASRHLMARDEHVVVRAAIYACFGVIFLQILIYGIGGLINLVQPDISPSETVMIWAAKNLVPEFLGALLLAGIVAAALSSASTFLSLVGFSVSNDIVRRSQPLTLNHTRTLMLITGLVVLVASYFFPPNIFWLMLFIGTAFASSWGPVAFMSVWSKRITAAGVASGNGKSRGKVVPLAPAPNAGPGSGSGKNQNHAAGSISAGSLRLHDADPSD